MREAAKEEEDSASVECWFSISIPLPLHAQRLPEHLHVAAAARAAAGHHLQQRGLTAARVPEKSQHLTGGSWRTAD